MSDPAAELKRLSAEAALAEVRSGTVIGLGTGSTAAFVISGLAERLRDGRLSGVRAVPTSEATARLARDAGIELVDLEPGGIDLAIDGCDEVDPQLRLIKGLGGALTREKLVALEAKRFLVVADGSKQVARLGEKAPVPVEVVPFGLAATLARLQALAVTCTVRSDAAGQPVRTDNGNLVVDVRPAAGFVPEDVARQLKLTAGVVEHGLFLGMASEALLADAGGIRRVTRA